MFGQLEDMTLKTRHNWCAVLGLWLSGILQYQCRNGWTITLPDGGLAEVELFPARWGAHTWPPWTFMSGDIWKPSYMTSSLFKCRKTKKTNIKWNRPNKPHFYKYSCPKELIKRMVNCVRNRGDHWEHQL